MIAFCFGLVFVVVVVAPGRTHNLGRAVVTHACCIPLIPALGILTLLMAL